MNFEDLAQDFLEDYWRLEPVEATHAGIHRHDSALPDWSADGQAQRQEWRKRQQTIFAALDDSQLDSTQQLDKKVVLAELAAEEIKEAWQWVRRAPAFYVEQALSGLNYLLARPDSAATPAERDENLLARLGSINGLLTQGRTNLNGELVPPEYVEIGQVAVRGAINFISNLNLPEKAVSESLRQQVLASLSDYGNFIENQLQPNGSFQLGAEFFERTLREQHGLDLTPDQLYALGEETTAQLQTRLMALAKELDPGQNWQNIVESLKADHPTRDTLLQAYADEAERARQFAIVHKLVDIPAGEQFEVRATAPFLRATMPLGHFDKTPPFAPQDNLGILYITPVDATLPAERQEELLAAHCYTAVRAICLHETYPGHHLQLWCAKLGATPLRRQFASTLFVEGWALYCEELMEETGYFDTPALTLWQLKNSMWRAVRIMLDVGLHSGKLNLETAAQLLVERAGLEWNTALGEARRYTTAPTQPSSYMLGRNRIVELRRQYMAQQGANFNLRTFHNRLLAFSSVSPALIPHTLESA